MKIHQVLSFQRDKFNQFLCWLVGAPIVAGVNISLFFLAYFLGRDIVSILALLSFTLWLIPGTISSQVYCNTPRKPYVIFPKPTKRFRVIEDQAYTLDLFGDQILTHVLCHKIVFNFCGFWFYLREEDIGHGWRKVPEENKEEVIASLIIEYKEFLKKQKLSKKGASKLKPEEEKVPQTSVVYEGRVK